MRPTRADLDRARGGSIPDVLAPSLGVLFCGINPSLWSAATGHHFARPGNRFWPALHLSGFTPRLLRPDEQGELPAYGLGVTNLVSRATARADELTADEMRAGRRTLERKVRRRRIGWLAVVGVTAYRVAFAERDAAVGEQSRRVGRTRVWVLPNPSGINASWVTPALVAAFSELRVAVQREDRP